MEREDSRVGLADCEAGDAGTGVDGGRGRARVVVEDAVDQFQAAGEERRDGDGRAGAVLDREGDRVGPVGRVKVAGGDGELAPAAGKD